MSLFGLFGELVSLPFEIVSDVSSALKGEETKEISNGIKDVGKELKDIIN